MALAGTVPQGGRALSQVTQFPSTFRCFMSHVIPFNKSFSALSRQENYVAYNQTTLLMCWASLLFEISNLHGPRATSTHLLRNKEELELLGRGNGV